MSRTVERSRGTRGARRGFARGRRAALAGGLALVVAAGAGGAVALGGGIAPQATDAAWVSEEAGSLSATAGTVAAPSTTCEGRNSAPNLLKLVPGEGGLEVTGYRVTITVNGAVPAEWQSGEAEGGVPFLPANTPTDVPAGTTTVAWGISGGWNRTWEGTVSVRALGPSGWESGPVQYDWSIGFDFLGGGYGSCTQG